MHLPTVSSTQPSLWKIDTGHWNETLYLYKGHFFYQATMHGEPTRVYHCHEDKSGCSAILFWDAVGDMAQQSIVHQGVHNHPAAKLHVEVNVKTTVGEFMDVLYEQVNNKMLPRGIITQP